MKTAVAICALVGLSTLTLCVGASQLNEEWFEKDRAFIGEVTAILKDDPQHADRVLFWFPVERQRLGFGYSLVERYVGKGYVGFGCEMLYLQDQLVSFRLKPSLGMHRELASHYAALFRGTFTLNSGGTCEPYYDDLKAATQPLPGCKVTSEMSGKMKFFCSPFSGVAYGTRGGYAGAPLPNRSAYLEVADEIDSAMCLRLLYSINPATRLTAYEHYRRNQAAYRSIADQVEARLQEVLKEVPQIETMRGCIVRREESLKVLESILKRDSANAQSE